MDIVPTPFFIAPDADNEPTLWLDNGLMDPTAVCRQSDLGGRDLVWALIGTHPNVTVREVIA